MSEQEIRDNLEENFKRKLFASKKVQYRSSSSCVPLTAKYLFKKTGLPELRRTALETHFWPGSPVH